MLRDQRRDRPAIRIDEPSRHAVPVRDKRTAPRASKRKVRILIEKPENSARDGNRSHRCSDTVRTLRLPLKRLLSLAYMVKGVMAKLDKREQPATLLAGEQLLQEIQRRLRSEGRL